jgi:hypothetical protein
MQDFETIESAELDDVTGGGWKGKLVKGAWEFAKWTGIPSAVGAGAAWVERQIRGPQQPEQPPQQPQQGQ